MKIEIEIDGNDEVVLKEVVRLADRVYTESSLYKKIFVLGLNKVADHLITMAGLIKEGEGDE